MDPKNRHEVFKTPQGSLGGPEEEKDQKGLSAKSTRITIRINSDDLAQIKSRAYDAGMPYQTLISTILHQFVSGKVTVNV